MHHGILKGTRGPRGGYELAREKGRITADNILRAAGKAVELDCTPVGNTALLQSVVFPVVRQAEEAFRRIGPLSGGMKLLTFDLAFC